MRKLDGKDVLRIKRDYPHAIWSEIGRLLAVEYSRYSKGGQVIPYQENAMRNAVKRMIVKDIVDGQ